MDYEWIDNKIQVIKRDLYGLNLEAASWFTALILKQLHWLEDVMISGQFKTYDELAEDLRNIDKFLDRLNATFFMNGYQHSERMILKLIRYVLDKEVNRIIEQKSVHFSGFSLRHLMKKVREGY